MNTDNQLRLATYIEDRRDALLDELMELLDDNLIQSHFREAIRFSGDWEESKTRGEKDQVSIVLRMGPIV